MKKISFIILCFIILLMSAGCGTEEKRQISDKTDKHQDEVHTEALKENRPDERSIEVLKETYPEYFQMSDFKGIEVYIWQMAENSFRCGLMEGTNRNKTAEEISALQFRSLSIEEAKAILNEIHVEAEKALVYPITQPYSDYFYVLDDEYRQRVTELLK